MKDKDPFVPVEKAVEIISEGGMIILIDDEDRENEGDLMMAAEKMTASGMNFMIKEGRGLVCCTMTGMHARRLGLEKLKKHGSARHYTNFLSPVDAAEGIETGISASDRTKTVQVLSSPESVPGDLAGPGHLFPLEAVPGGLLERRGHTEASVELCRLAGLEAVGVICEIINNDGTMSRKYDLVEFAERHGLKILAIESLADYITAALLTNEEDGGKI